MIEFPKTGCMGVQPATVKGPCAAGVDIRPGSWDVVVGDVQQSQGTKLPVVRPVFIGKVVDEEQVLFVLRQYRVRFAVADTRPETTLAKRLQVACVPHGIKLWRAEYNTAPSTVEVQENAVEGILKLDRTLTLDAVWYAFSQGLTVILPQNYREVTRGSFVREMCSSSRVPTKWLGRDAYAWEHQGPDHGFHAFNYLLTAVRMSNLLAYGGDRTMGATRGVVTSRAGRVVTRVDTGHRADRTVVAKSGIDWKKAFGADDDEALYLEA